MSRNTVLCCLVFGGVAVFVSFSAGGSTGSSEIRTIAPQEFVPAATIRFEKNLGQASPEILYLAQTQQGAALLQADRVTFQLPEGETFAMRWTGGRTADSVEGLEINTARSHYYLGADPDGWVRNVPSYDRVRYRGVYPGIDLEFYGADGLLEYDFVVQPGADPNRIRLELTGGAATQGEDGALSQSSAAGSVRHHSVRVLQTADKGRQEIPGRFQTNPDGTVQFDLGEYDRTRELRIDPRISFATFLGGGSAEHAAAGVYTTPNDLWVAGETNSQNFPRPGGQPGPGGQGVPSGLNGFVAHYRKAPGAATFTLMDTLIIGGSGTDRANGIARDSQNNIYVGGNTNSSDFITGPSLGQTDAWIVRIGATGPSTTAARTAADTGGRNIPEINRSRRFGTSFDDHFESFAIPPDPRGGNAPFGWGTSVFDYDNDGDLDILFHGEERSNGPNPYNNLTLLDAGTLERIGQMDLLRNGGKCFISGVTQRRSDRRLIYTGSCNTNLEGNPPLVKPGNAGIFKQFLGSVSTNTLSSGQRVPLLENLFLDDDTDPAEQVFSQGIQLHPASTMAFVGGQIQSPGGDPGGYLNRVTGVPSNVNTSPIARFPGKPFTDFLLDRTLNIDAFATQISGSNRQLFLELIDPEAFNVFDSFPIGPVGGGGNFTQRGAMTPNGSHPTVLGGVQSGLPVTPGAPQSNFGGGSSDAGVIQIETLQLDPLGIVTGGSFTPAPLVPYGFYTAFIDWPDILGLRVPDLMNNKFQSNAAGMEVLLNGKPAPITAISPRQFNFIAHEDVNQKSQATVQLRYRSRPGDQPLLSNIVRMATADHWVNFFKIGQTVAAIHSRGVLSRNNPLRQDDILQIFGSGLGDFGSSSITAFDLTPTDRVFRAASIPKVEAVIPDGRRFDLEVVFGGPSPGSTAALGQLNVKHPGDFWVFCAGVTDVEYTITVTDTQQGNRPRYTNPLGESFRPILDTQAFATCP